MGAAFYGDASFYGDAFDALAGRWAVLENIHDTEHPNRDQCGGVGDCSMMMAAHKLETQMIDALVEWRRETLK
jgi:hypothetical protein